MYVEATLICNPVPNPAYEIRLEERSRFGHKTGLSRSYYGEIQFTARLHIYLTVVYIYILQYTIIFKSIN
jgi:hypothetical protein